MYYHRSAVKSDMCWPVGCLLLASSTFCLPHQYGCVFVCVCPYLNLLIINGMMKCNMKLLMLVTQALQLSYGSCS